jgi:hypothetical protein
MAVDNDPVIHGLLNSVMAYWCFYSRFGWHSIFAFLSPLSVQNLDLSYQGL